MNAPREPDAAPSAAAEPHPKVVPVPACPACGAADRRIVHPDLPDRKYGVPGSWSFATCSGCGLAYLTTRLAEPVKGYPQTYVQHHGTAPPDVTGMDLCLPKRVVRQTLLAYDGYAEPGGCLRRSLGWVLGRIPRLRMLARFALILFPSKRHGTRLLEIGCGNGRMCAIMERLGWRVSAVEPDPLAASAARQITAADIYPSIEAVDLLPGSCDVVVMTHVFEHVADPAALLARCLRLLRPGGLLGVCVPNWDSLCHGLFGEHCYHLDPPRHVMMYTPRTLTQALSAAGFRPRSVWTTSEMDGMLMYCAGWEATRGTPPGRLRRLVVGLVSLFSPWILPGRGEELVAWAEKPVGHTAENFLGAQSP